MRKKVIFLLAILLLMLSIPVYRAQALPIQVRVAFNQNQAPYHFVDSRGNAAGLHIDMLKHIAQSAGYELEFFPMKTSTECLEAIRLGQVDIVLDITNRLEDSGRISETLSEEIICIVSKKDLEDIPLNMRGTAVVQLETITPAVSAQLQVARRLVVSDQEKAIRMLGSGKADIAVVLKESALYNLSRLGMENDYEISNSYVGTLSFALQVARNDHQLLRTLNEEIAHLRVSDDYSEIRKTWSQPDSEDMTYLWMKRTVLVLLMAVLVVGLYAATVSHVRRALRKQVEKQTLALQEANREIRRHLEQLEAESDMRNRIIRYSHMAMVLFDEAGGILLANNSAVALAEGWSGEVREWSNIVLMPVFGQIVQSYDVPALFREMDGGMEGVHTIELKRGTQRCRYRYSLQPIFKAEKVWAVLLVVEDITDEEAQRNAKFEEEKNRTLNQVVAGIAHEIKNPLTAIKTFVEVLRGAHTDSKFMEDFTCYVPAEVERINRLVEGLISYAKPARGTMGWVDLAEVVHETCFFAQSTNRNRNIKITQAVEGEHGITGNRDQIKQVLINIVINGMESMDEKLSTLPEDTQLELSITLGSSENGSVITVRDEGMGMTAEAIAQCMNPFFTTKRTGTGLGLTLSKQYVRENNGELTISSEVGAYTEIQIEFGREKNET